MTGTPKPKLAHLGLFTNDIEPMLAFYTGVFGLTITDEGTYGDPPSRIVFMSNDPDEHHQFVLVQPGDPAGREQAAMAQQISFLVESVDEVKEMHDRVVAAGISIDRTITHGNAWSAYFHDMDGNRIEIYCHSPWYVPQPHAHAMDFSQSVEAIMAQTEEHCRATPGFMPAEERRAYIAAKMAGAG